MWPTLAIGERMLTSAVQTELGVPSDIWGDAVLGRRKTLNKLYLCIVVIT